MWLFTNTTAWGQNILNRQTDRHFQTQCNILRTKLSLIPIGLFWGLENAELCLLLPARIVMGSVLADPIVSLPLIYFGFLFCPA